MTITFEEAQDIIIKSEEIISASEIQNAYDEVHQQCRNCHKKFRK